jgi:hypothetical protein
MIGAMTWVPFAGFLVGLILAIARGTRGAVESLGVGAALGLAIAIYLSSAIDGAGVWSLLGTAALVTSMYTSIWGFGAVPAIGLGLGIRWIVRRYGIRKIAIGIGLAVSALAIGLLIFIGWALEHYHFFDRPSEFKTELAYRARHLRSPLTCSSWEKAFFHALTYDGFEQGCRRMAERGDAVAQYYMAQLAVSKAVRDTRDVFRNESLVSDDDSAHWAEALRWLQLAGQQDYAPALSASAFQYLSGKHVPKNEEMALELSLRAAEYGDFTAAVLLAKMYSDGQGVPKDLVQCLMWLEIASSRYRVDDALHDTIEKRHQEIAASMSAEQIAEAHRLALAHGR